MTERSRSFCSEIITAVEKQVKLYPRKRNIGVSDFVFSHVRQRKKRTFTKKTNKIEIIGTKIARRSSGHIPGIGASRGHGNTRARAIALIVTTATKNLLPLTVYFNKMLPRGIIGPGSEGDR